jgi:hypothetical protein
VIRTALSQAGHGLLCEGSSKMFYQAVPRFNSPAMTYKTALGATDKEQPMLQLRSHCECCGRVLKIAGCEQSHFGA